MAAKAVTGPAALRGSRQAKQSLVVMLEALAGTCSTSEAAERLKISASRYYQLETRALQGMPKALEPRPRGPKKTKHSEIQALKEEKRELRQARSLVRAASRSVGVKPLRARGAQKKSAPAGVRRGARRCSRRSGRRPRVAGRSNPKALLRPIEASEVARERVKIVLLTLCGQWRVKDALARLSISRTRFQDLRRRMLEAALAALEPRPLGRPPAARAGQRGSPRPAGRPYSGLQHPALPRQSSACPATAWRELQMPESIEKRTFDNPDDLLDMKERGGIAILKMGSGVSGMRAVFEPGWVWEKHEKPLLGNPPSCPMSHTGYCISGTLVVRMVDTGVETRIKAGDFFEIPAGHDGYVEGDERVEAILFAPADSEA